MNNTEAGISNYSYPTSSVIWAHTLLGGAVGGAVIGFGGVLFEIIFGNSSPMFAIIISTLLFATVGAIIGLVPSILTGWFVSRHRVVIVGANDYLKLFITGFVMTVLCLVLLITALELQSFMHTYLNTTFNHIDYTDTSSDFSNDDILVFSKAALFLGSIGGISSVILGKIIVPKAKYYNK